MTFTTPEFFWFLPLVGMVFYSLPQRHQMPFLLVASYFFYAFWSVPFLVLLIATMLWDWYLALKIEAAAEPRSRKGYLVLSLITNLGVLFTFKYLNFFSSMFGQSSFDIILPFGISFYTFHALSYIIDVYRKDTPAEKDFVAYSGYVMFFPQLVAGPIARASHLMPQFRTPKTLTSSRLIQGAYLVAKGYILKLVIADRLGGFVDAQWNGELTATPLNSLQASYFFAFQIYADFSGYTLIARGIAKWFDFDLVENFATPYFSASITEFWRRWHISLSTWLRDYLYVPLGGNRRGTLLTYRNLIITMLLGGLWHGANWTFVVWGGLHGCYLAAEKYLGVPERVPKVFRIFFTFHLVLLGWIFFRSQNLDQAFGILSQLPLVFTQPLSAIAWPLWGLAFAFMLFEYLEREWKFESRFESLPSFARTALIYGTIAFVALFLSRNPKEFIYFQF